MNERVNKFLLARDKFILERRLRQSGNTNSTCGPFVKNKERIKKSKQEDSWYIYQNELEKASFQNTIAYGDFKDLSRITASDRILHDEAFNIAKNQKHDTYQRVLASIVYKFFDKKPSGGGIEN